MGDIVRFPGQTVGAIPARQVLEQALEQDFDEVVILGTLKTGEAYTATSTSDGGDVFWLLERAKHAVHKHADELEAGT